MKVTSNSVEAALAPLTRWHHNCHGASMAVIRAFGGRVARGWCRGVTSQHSWAVLGADCYSPDPTIVDASLWSFDSSVSGVWIGTLTDGLHEPHGGGSIWSAGRPLPAQGPPIKLKPSGRLSRAAKDFLELLGPLDLQGWQTLANLPVLGWPAAEIIAAMDDTQELSALVPIDRLGMLTERNPGGLYLVSDES